MLHLFNKTYMQTDALVDVGYDRVVISSNCASTDITTAGVQLAHVTTLSDLIGPDGEYKSLLELFTILHEYNNTTSRPVMIYADTQAFVAIFCGWLKTLCKNATANTAWVVMSSYATKEYLVGGYTYVVPSSFKTFVPSQQVVESVFTTTIVDSHEAATFVDTIRDKVSVELLLASYLFNNSNKTELKATIVNLLTRHVEQNIIEAKNTVYRRATKPSFASAIGLGVYDVMNVHTVSEDPAIGALTNSAFVLEPGSTQPGSRSKIDLKKLTQQDIVQLAKIFDVVYPEFEHTSVYDLYMNIVKNGTMTDAELDDVIAAGKTTDEGFWSTTDQEKINIYLLDYIIQQSSNAKILSQFELR